MASSEMDREELLSGSNRTGKSSASESIHQYRMSGPGAMAVVDLGLQRSKLLNVGE